MKTSFLLTLGIFALIAGGIWYYFFWRKQNSPLANGAGIKKGGTIYTAKKVGPLSSNSAGLKPPVPDPVAEDPYTHGTGDQDPGDTSYAGRGR